MDSQEKWDLMYPTRRLKQAHAELTEALRAMTEAHQLIVNGYGGDAIAVLEQGIAEARYVLHLEELG